ncbi:hypothetical protein FEF34_14200 [Streptomyces marianii]|uniref:Uncharacterized protein n=1 Tax=Streptomyces marianii TaxID=1817406 RepID=A0A5R9E2X7_9ACTN|nr:hypothetical protein FEF34_14200 [Streptomyces marianii]
MRHRVQHAERDRRPTTGPVRPKDVTRARARARPGQAMRSSTTGVASYEAPGAAMSKEPSRDCRA